ncbi:hypothetical protein QM042_01955 [Escherichia coli]|uniref:hypothetical protein n=1 Tax=Escherichia coli TaxID=562 RepID=UPI0039889BBC
MAQIDTYRSGEAVSLSFAFNARDIHPPPHSGRDGAGSIIVGDEPLDITGGQMSIPVVVSAEHNLLTDQRFKPRAILVKAVASGLTHEERTVHVLLNSFELSIPGQSFATVADAQMQAIDMLNGDTLLADGDGLMRKRLIEATRRVKTLPFSIRRGVNLNSERFDRPQNMLNVYDVPWGADGAYRHDLIDWEKMTQDKFDEFPDYFKQTLMLAVVNEACEIANGNDVAAAREDGILSESIGETTNMYRVSMGVRLHISRAGRKTLVSYINNPMPVSPSWHRSHYLLLVERLKIHFRAFAW